MNKIKRIVILLLLITPILVYAQEPVVTNENTVQIEPASEDIVQTTPREGLPNLGVNKKWTITDKNRPNVMKTPYVNADKKIYDFSNILTKEEEAVLKEKIDTFMQKYNKELIIVTYNLPYSNDRENATFASDFYDYNDFGLDHKYYDGIVLFRNTYEADKYYDMYTFGEAQLYFDQTRYDDILDSIYNDLHSGNYLSGFSYFISRVDYYISSGVPSSMSNKYIDSMGYIKSNYVAPYGIAFLISLIVTIVVMSILINKNKMVKKATNASEYLNKATVNYTKKQDNFISTHTSSYTISSSSGGGGGGGFSGGGSSGGGFSSGGGRHG